MTDPRERRRRRHESEKERADVAGALKKYRIPIAIVIVWAAIIGFQVAQAQGVIGGFGEDCPGHWHSTFDLHINEEKVVFTANPAYTLEGGMPASTHMHQGQEGVWHFEPPRKDCIPYKDALRRVDVDLGSDRIALTGDYHESRPWGGTWSEDGNHTLRAYMQEFEQEWEPISISKLNGMQVPDGSRVIIVYGQQDEAQLAALQQGATPLSPNLAPPAGGGGGFDDASFIAITTTTIFAILAIMLWYNFAKKTW